VSSDLLLIGWMFRHVQNYGVFPGVVDVFQPAAE
jgi:hypothetical protein